MDKKSVHQVYKAKIVEMFRRSIHDTYEEINMDAFTKKGKGKGKKLGNKNRRRCDVDPVAAPDLAAARQMSTESNHPPV